MKAVLVVMSLIVLGQWGIAPVYADEGSYISALRNFDVLPNVQFNQPSWLLLNAGRQVCVNAQAGMEKRAMIRDVMNNYGPTIDAVQATFLVNIALQQLCDRTTGAA